MEMQLVFGYLYVIEASFGSNKDQSVVNPPLQAVFECTLKSFYFYNYLCHHAF